MQTATDQLRKDDAISFHVPILYVCPLLMHNQCVTVFLYNMFQVFINLIVCLLVGADISTTEQIAQATLDTNRQMDGMSTTHLAVVRGLVILWFVRVCARCHAALVFSFSLNDESVTNSDLLRLHSRMISKGALCFWNMASRLVHPYCTSICS